MQQSYQAIKRLVADFKAQEAAYLSPSYQESQVRQDFIDKFFTDLGWDVTHERQKNPYEQEVHIENKVRMSGSSQRRADYAFFLSPNFRDPKFFVEAKKPSRNLTNADDYYQAIRYGWNAKTPLVILTDFEEFHVLDCRFKPNIDEAMSRKVETFHYSDYAVEDKFARIYYLFSREAVAGGSIEKRATELSKPRGKAGQKGSFKGGFQAVDEAFLEELDEYRTLLAKAFKKADEKLEGEQLTEAVQRTIDRLVFIRFLEDKGIEEKSIIKIRGQKSPWKAFVSLCKRCEPKYNGLVFKPHRILDEIELAATDEETFAEICAELADPGSPYDFNQIPISILGSIYERFLGKVVHATDKRVKVEEKPEVRKAGGVYYTPEYIVRYIVKETVGKLIDDKTPAEIALMAFADIACGSGSFLIEVYAQLLDYYVRYFLAHPDKAKPDDVFERDGKLQLTLKKKKEILLNNIYGVDLDFQATEVTQLSLYLKLLEDATMNDAYQFGLFKETILPDLKANIVCGNSLVGRDITEGSLFSNVDEADLKPMDFEDAFPEIMKKGGFDAVVGNPPYGASLSTQQKDYLKKHYDVMVGKFDSYGFFVERGISLLKMNRSLGYIMPHTWLTVIEAISLRKYLLDHVRIEEIVRLPTKVFADATVNTVMAFFRRDSQKEGRDSNNVRVVVIDADDKLDQITDDSGARSITMQSGWQANDGVMFNLSVSTAAHSILEKLKAVSIRMDDLCEFTVGVQAYDKYAGQSQATISNRIYHSDRKKDDSFNRELNGNDVSRYHLEWDGKSWISYGNWLAHPRQRKFFQGPRILVREITGAGEHKIFGTLATEEYINYKTILNVLLNQKSLQEGYKLEYFLGIVNSNLMSFFFANSSNKMVTKTFPRISILDMKGFPIRVIEFKSSNDKSKHDEIVMLVAKILDSKQKLSSFKTDAEVTRHEGLCSALDRQIDKAVYELYGLTEEEIKIVEGTSVH